MAGRLPLEGFPSHSTPRSPTSSGTRASPWRRPRRTSASGPVPTRTGNTRTSRPTRAWSPPARSSSEPGRASPPTTSASSPPGEEEVEGGQFDFSEPRSLDGVRIDYAFTELERDESGRAWARLRGPDGRSAAIWGGRELPLPRDLHPRHSLASAARHGLGAEPDDPRPERAGERRRPRPARARRHTPLSGAHASPERATRRPSHPWP
jgi:hypothetical protein